MLDQHCALHHAITPRQCFSVAHIKNTSKSPCEYVLHIKEKSKICVVMKRSDIPLILFQYYILI